MRSRSGKPMACKGGLLSLPNTGGGGMDTVKRIGQIHFAEILLAVSLFLIGTFHEYLSCALSAAMLVWLAVRAVREKKLRVFLNLTGLSVCCVALFYALSAFWAVDNGMAFIGFLKFLPVPLYLLVLMQRHTADDVIASLPYIAAAMAVLSAIGMQIPLFESFFSVAGRLAGFFQYPNTFALFLLVAELTAVAKEKHTPVDIVVIVLLLLGLLYTGSRTVFVLAVLSNGVLIFTGKHRRVKIGVFAGVLLVVAGGAVWLALSGQVSAFSRFLTISLTESTFIGRLLYFRDALPLVLEHPFGLGYLGYYYLQSSVQTGVYSVMYVHNDFLQLLLDVGWLPFALFAAAVFKSIFFGKKPFYKRVVLCVMALHSCFDFDLQFIAMFFVMLLFMDHREGKECILTARGGLAACSAGLAAVCLYGGVFLSLSRFGKYAAAQAIYPWNTQNEIRLLAAEEDLDTAVGTADDILERNEYVILAYSVKARQAYSQGNFAKLIDYKRLIFEKAPFEYEEYEEYGYMLINGIALYQQAGDTDSAQICRQELLWVKDRVHTAGSRLSRLGGMIDDQPVTWLPEDMEAYIAALEGTDAK